MSFRSLPLGYLLVTLVAGCTDDHHISTSDYPRSCSTDSDCAAVYEGTIGCCGASCPNAAINQMSLPAYEAAISSRTPMCSPAPPCVFIPVDRCPGAVSCVSGTCTFQTPDAGTVQRN